MCGCAALWSLIRGNKANAKGGTISCTRWRYTGTFQNCNFLDFRVCLELWSPHCCYHYDQSPKGSRRAGSLLNAHPLGVCRFWTAANRSLPTLLLPVLFQIACCLLLEEAVLGYKPAGPFITRAGGARIAFGILQQHQTNSLVLRAACLCTPLPPYPCSGVYQHMLLGPSQLLSFTFS